MSQKTDLQATNTDLQAILDLVNSLPDKEEGPSYETCTVSSSSNLPTVSYLEYTPEAGVCTRTVDINSKTIQNVVSGSILCVQFSNPGRFGPFNMVNCELLYPSSVASDSYCQCFVIKITGTSDSPTSFGFAV